MAFSKIWLSKIHFTGDFPYVYCLCTLSPVFSQSAHGGVTLMAGSESMHEPKSIFSLSPKLSYLCSLSSVQFNLSHVQLFATPWTEHTRPPCPSPTPGVYPNPCPLSRRCHPTILSSGIPFSSCPQSFPASGSFQMSQLFASCG